jgi:hypothetical protein
MTILGDSVGANGCSPEEEVLSHAQGRRQKVVGLLTQASQIRQGCPLAVHRPLGRTVLRSDATRPGYSLRARVWGVGSRVS